MTDRLAELYDNVLHDLRRECDRTDLALVDALDAALTLAWAYLPADVAVLDLHRIHQARMRYLDEHYAQTSVTQVFPNPSVQSLKSVDSPDDRPKD